MSGQNKESPISVTGLAAVLCSLGASLGVAASANAQPDPGAVSLQEKHNPASAAAAGGLQSHQHKNGLIDEQGRSAAQFKQGINSGQYKERCAPRAAGAMPPAASGPLEMNQSKIESVQSKIAARGAPGC